MVWMIIVFLSGFLAGGTLGLLGAWMALDLHPEGGEGLDDGQGAGNAPAKSLYMGAGERDIGSLTPPSPSATLLG